MNEHVHSIAFAMEGPLWFCACGVEFFPARPELTKAYRARRRPSRIRLKVSPP